MLVIIVVVFGLMSSQAAVAEPSSMMIAQQSDAPTPSPSAAPPNVPSTNAAPASQGGGAAYTIQVASDKTEREAWDSYLRLRRRFPRVLGKQDAVVRPATIMNDIRYRVYVGTFGTREEATAFCESLIKAGGVCITQKK